MIRVSDAANTRKTDDAATQRNIRFVKCQKWQGYVEWQIFFKWRLNGIALLVTVLAAVTFSFASPTHAVIRFGSANTVSLSQGLVGYWPLDGAVANWNTNTTQDLSGNGNTGWIIAMPTSTSPVAGKIGQALTFDGSSSKGR